LDQLAERTGLSKAYLSRLESAERQPSVATLLSLARVLDVPMSVLLGEADGPASLAIYRDDHAAHAVNGLTITPRSGFSGSRALDAMKVGIEADRPPAPFARHRGEEWVYVLSGILRLEYGDDCHLLLTGEAAHFDAGRPHRLGTPGPSTEVLLVAADGTNDFRRAHHYSEPGAFSALGE
jgi:transcriptional regulator with XRE-family HTH domain